MISLSPLVVVGCLILDPLLRVLPIIQQLLRGNNLGHKKG
ncbi:hypothetical protein SLEP1_g11479 [Rubroshorea leprosula]|uniref:Uncharacterized protein n=1 Tax=Rubroshorea leprosula TaxID=152421 RepID=A0AAV5IH89_9ROSI|nr:hypothetical protein SLEP1_g11479 [Rubroshorea leprosula]